MSQSCQTVTANLEASIHPAGQGRLFSAGLSIAVFRSRDGSVLRLRPRVLTEAVRSPTAFSASVLSSARCMPAASMSAREDRPATLIGGLKVYPISLNSKEQLIITLK